MKKIAKIICPFVFVLFSFIAFAQEINEIPPPPPKLSEDDIEKNEVFYNVNQMPEFPGGQDSLYSFLTKNVQYPDSALKYKVQGKVFVSFIVEKDGRISNVKNVNKTYPDLVKEALRVVKLMPNWNAGKQDGKLVRVKFSLPINFKIQN